MKDPVVVFAAALAIVPQVPGLPNEQYPPLVPALDHDSLIQRAVHIADHVYRRTNLRCNIDTDANRQLKKITRLQPDLATFAGHVNKTHPHRSANRRHALRSMSVGWCCNRSTAGKKRDKQKCKSTHGSSPEVKFRETLCHGSETLNVRPMTIPISESFNSHDQDSRRRTAANAQASAAGTTLEEARLQPCHHPPIPETALAAGVSSATYGYPNQGNKPRNLLRHTSPQQASPSSAPSSASKEASPTASHPNSASGSEAQPTAGCATERTA